MSSENQRVRELLGKVEDLQLRLEEAEETLRAIGSGEVDALVVSGPAGKQVYTLRGAEHPYRVLVETMNEGAATLARDGTILYCNQALAALLKVPLEHLIGQSFDQYVAPADHSHFTARLRTFARDREEIYLMTEDGTAFPVLISYCAFDHSGLRGISLAITDLTQQKRNEEFIAEERLARSIIDQAGEVIIVCDEHGTIIRASRLAYELCGENPLMRPFDRLVDLRMTETGQRFSLLPFMPDNSYQNVEVEFEDRKRAKSCYFILNLSPLKGNRNQVIGYIVTLTDITDRKLARKQLLEMNSQLERMVLERTRELQETQAQCLHVEKLAAIGQLSASIAHEFNNPLQAVLTVLQALNKRIELEEDDKVLLGLAIGESNPMKNRIRNLQDFNRPSSGRMTFMDLNACINALLILFQADLKRKKITMISRFAENLPQVMAIPDQIKQVFFNLLRNAADACAPGCEITISTWREKQRVAVAIEDTGAGISPEIQDHIFQPFFTTKSEDKGTGLGLSICHGIVQKHQGEIRLESLPGRGSTFTVLLPIGEGSDEPGAPRDTWSIPG